jgi:hypothetical protein
MSTSRPSTPPSSNGTSQQQASTFWIILGSARRDDALTQRSSAEVDLEVERAALLGDLNRRGEAQQAFIDILLRGITPAANHASLRFSRR